MKIYRDYVEQFYVIYYYNIEFLQIKIHITLIDDILFNTDVAEGDGGVGMVENFLQEFNIIKLFIMVVAEGFA